MLGIFGSINTSNGTDVTVVRNEVNLSTRSCCMQPDTMSWLYVTLPAASALAAKLGKTSVSFVQT